MISTLEKEITFRFLKARKKDGFLNVISIFSFIGISLGVAVLIIVMSVMNGFRTELINKIIGFNAHAVVKPYNKASDLMSDKDFAKGIFSNDGEAVIFYSNSTKGVLLKGYLKNDFIELVRRYDISYHEKAFGQLFCDNSSKDILNMLLAEAKKSQVTIKTNCTIKKYEHKEQFIIETCNEKFKAKSLAIATGGLSVPTLGGTDFGYEIAKMFGHKITSLRPALVPFVFTDKFKLISEKLSGISLYARLSLNKYEFYENILFTHRGLSGPAVLQISSYWKEGDEIEINLMPSMDCMKLLLEQK